MIDVNKAMLDPTMVFKDPKDVVANVELTAIRKSRFCAAGNTTPASWRWQKRRPGWPFASRICSTAFFRHYTHSM